MRWLVEKVRYLAIIGVLSLLIGAILSLILGVIRTVKAGKLIYDSFLANANEFNLVIIFECLDAFLVATALLVMGISLYELFIGELTVPDWMLVKDLDQLKAKFGYVVIPVIAVKFVEKLLQSQDATEILYYGIAVALVSVSLTAFDYVSHKEKKDDIKLRAQEKEGEKRAKDVSKKEEIE